MKPNLGEQEPLDKKLRNKLVYIYTNSTLESKLNPDFSKNIAFV